MSNIRKYGDDLDDEVIVYPVTAEIKFGCNPPTIMSFDCLDDLLLYIKREVLGAVRDTDRLIVPRGRGVLQMYHGNMFAPNGMDLMFEFDDDKTDAIHAGVMYHMPVPLSQAMH